MKNDLISSIIIKYISKYLWLFFAFQVRVTSLFVWYFRHIGSGDVKNSIDPKKRIFWHGPGTKDEGLVVANGTLMLSSTFMI